MNIWTKRKLEGKCPRCGRKLPEDREYIMCEKCLQWERKYHAIQSATRIKDGKCGRCGKPYNGKFKNCDSCRERERIRKNKSNKLKAIERWKNIDR